jgi:2-polyprenyl-3-methyl-5-hydroxy-6-metoxy-1,4-benzoquinol methylase
MEEERVSKEFVFKTDEDGKLSFVGNFEGFYKSDNDPWGQRGEDDRLREYYTFSRSKILNTIDFLIDSKAEGVDILEVGCGLGYVSSKLHTELSGNANVTGMDISPTAIEKAKALFPSLEFIVGDIRSECLNVGKKYDIVIMVEVLWYILEKLPQVFVNIDGLLKNSGFLVFSNGFPREQKYGREIIDGFDGLVRYVCSKYFGKYRIVKAHVDYSGKFLFNDGILVLMKSW